MEPPIYNQIEAQDSDRSVPQILSSNYVIDNSFHNINEPVTLPPIFLADPEYVFPEEISPFTLEQLQRLSYTSNLSRKICWLSIVDCILVSFILYFGVYYFLFIVIFLPIVGFIGAKRYNKILCLIYLVYLVVVLILRIYLLIFMPAIAIIIIQGLIMILEVYVCILDFKFLKILLKVTVTEKMYLMGMLPPPHSEQSIPSNVAVKIIESPPNIYNS